MKKLCKYLLLLILLAGCQGGAPTQPLTATELDATASQTPELAPSPTISGPTLTASATATLDARLLPERWQEWPIVPEVTGRAIEIYRQGLALGNDPHAFSKVGDCQSVKAAMMGYLDHPDRIPQTPEYQVLQETIDNFSGYFDTDGQVANVPGYCDREVAEHALGLILAAPSPGERPAEQKPPGCAGRWRGRNRRPGPSRCSAPGRSSSATPWA